MYFIRALSVHSSGFVIFTAKMYFKKVYEYIINYIFIVEKNYIDYI